MLAMLFAAAVAGVAAVDPVHDDRAAARDWAAVEAEAGRLPVTFEALEKYPVSYRKATFHLLDPAAKSALVQEHLTMVLGDPTLTRDQRKAIQEMRALAVPAVYDIGNPGRQALQEAIDEICVRTEKLFRDDQACYLGMTKRG
ncbi:MAG TPA: hypothetical protein VLD59_14060 [Steroidobacteraceae bacterium]|nr:hypothetical protein [Steroidobacteraceae bacterium]